MAETWLIRYFFILGDVGQALTVNIPFHSNNESFNTFSVLTTVDTDYVKYDGKRVYDFVDYDWVNQAYRTVTFDDPVETAAPALYAWFNSLREDGQPNAVKQAPPPAKLTFDLSTLDLPAGTYNVKVLPKGDGVTYRDAALAECKAVEWSRQTEWDDPIQTGDSLEIKQVYLVDNGGEELIIE